MRLETEILFGEGYEHEPIGKEVPYLEMWNHNMEMVCL